MGLWVVVSGQAMLLFGQPVIADVRSGDIEQASGPYVEVKDLQATPGPDHIALDWTALVEVGIIGYQLEKKVVLGSLAGNTFNDRWETLSFIEGKGFPDKPATYTVIDSTYVPNDATILYRLLQVQEDGAADPLEVLEVGGPLPTVFSARTYTRPDNPIVTIEYKLAEKVRVKIYAYDSSGRFSVLLINKMHEPGNYREYFDGSDRKSGLYICKIIAGSETWIEPMLLIK